MTLGADSGSTRFTPTTLMVSFGGNAPNGRRTYLSRSICGHKFELAPAPAETRSRTDVETELFKSSTVRSSAQLMMVELILLGYCSGAGMKDVHLDALTVRMRMGGIGRALSWLRAQLCRWRFCLHLVTGHRWRHNAHCGLYLQ